MRLRDLNPSLEDAGDGAMYLEFACPAHGVGHMEHADLSTNFEGFPDVIRIKIARTRSTRVWGWNGETDFDKLVIWPSIAYNNHWHEYVGGAQQNQPGEVTTV